MRWTIAATTDWGRAYCIHPFIVPSTWYIYVTIRRGITVDFVWLCCKNRMPRKNQAEEDMDDDESNYPSSTRSEKSVSTLSNDEMQRKVNDIVIYLLISDQKKYPIKRADITKNVLKEQARAFNPLMKEAIETLKNVFGIEVVELDDKKQKTYILANNIDNDTDFPHQEWPPEDDAKMGLVMIVLSMIFMNGNVMVDTLLYSSLKKLGVDVESRHEQFGDVKKLLTQEFVRQGYLEYTRQPNTDPPLFDYAWGPRAKVETSKTMVLNFVCQLYGDVEPQSWKSQWKDAQRTDGAEAQAGSDDT